MTDLELKLIRAIESSDVQKTLACIVENICGSRAAALKLVEMVNDNTIHSMPDSIQTITLLAIKFGKLGAEHRDLPST